MGSAVQPRKPLLDPDQPGRPAMLLLANPDSSLRPEFQEWTGDQTFELDEGTLPPTWRPREHPEDGHILSEEERVWGFRDELENVLSGPRQKPLTPEDVLKALTFLRALYGPR